MLARDLKGQAFKKRIRLVFFVNKEPPHVRVRPFLSEGAVGPSSVPGVAWSDHWSFSKFGVPAVMTKDAALFATTNITYRATRLTNSTTSGFPVSQAGSIVSPRALPNWAGRLLAASPFYLHFPAPPCIG